MKFNNWHEMLSEESKRVGGMHEADFYKVQNAITRMVLRSDPGFLVLIERNFRHEKKVLQISKDEKIWNGQNKL